MPGTYPLPVLSWNILYYSSIMYNSLCTVHNVHSKCTVHNIHKLVKYWYKWDEYMKYQHIKHNSKSNSYTRDSVSRLINSMLIEENKNPNITWTVNQEGVTNDWQSIVCKYNEWSVKNALYSRLHCRLYSCTIYNIYTCPIMSKRH